MTQQNKSVSPVLEKRLHQTLSKIELKDKPKVNISQELLTKIWYLCHRINDVEWSGILFYKSEGEISNLSNMKFDCIDFYLMNKGSHAYTEYESDDTLIMYKMSNKYFPPRVKEGKLHSHNSMAVFHSGTDWDDLFESAENESYYLSLVVNNKGEFDCKLAWYGTRDIVSKGSFSYTGSNGEPVVFEQETTIKDKCIFWVNCEVNVEINPIFVSRTNLIIKEAAEKLAQKSNIIYPSYTQGKMFEEEGKSWTKYKTTDFSDVNSLVNINKNLTRFMCSWLHPTSDNTFDLQEILSAINVQYLDSSEEDAEALLECLVEEIEIIADEFFGRRFTQYKVLAQKVKAEIEAYSTEFPELCFDLSEAISEYLKEGKEEHELVN